MHPNTSRGVRVGVLVVFLACQSREDTGLTSASDPPSTATPVNVLLLTADTTRADSIGCYDGDAVTPAIDSLARDGVVFLDAHSVAFGTTPSHASMMTSLPAAAHGIYDNETALHSSATTLAEVLSAGGYATAAFVGAVPLAYHLGLGQGFGTYDDDFPFDPNGDLGEYSRHERRAGATVDRFLEWMDSSSRGPFFAWLHFYDPHQPYWPPGSEGEPLYIHHRSDLRKRMSRDQDLFDSTLGIARGRYLAEIESMDAAIGRALERLKNDGTYDSTLVIFVSDHGENFAEHGVRLLFDHAALFDEVTRLPLVVKLPGSERGGTRTDALVGSLDLAPTILDIVGLSPPRSWEGRSLRRVADGSRETFRESLVLEGADREEIAVRTKTHLYRELATELRGDPEVFAYLGYAPGQPEELWMIDDDPGEQTNPANSSADLAALKEIASRFLERRLREGGVSSLRDEHIKGLQALGYSGAPSRRSAGAIAAVTLED